MKRGRTVRPETLLLVALAALLMAPLRGHEEGPRETTERPRGTGERGEPVVYSSLSHVASPGHEAGRTTDGWVADLHAQRAAAHEAAVKEFAARIARSDPRGRYTQTKEQESREFGRIPTTAEMEARQHQDQLSHQAGLDRPLPATPATPPRSPRDHHQKIPVMGVTKDSRK